MGGGMGIFDRGDGVLDRPMFEHAARYYTQWAGAPTSVYDYGRSDRSNDVGCRPRFAAWDHEVGEDAVYVAWHTNAPSPARGTASYAYAPVASGTLEDFDGVPGSLELMAAIHQQLIDDIRKEWDPNWQDRGKRTAYFGEVNPNHNPEMPATLIEVAFHSTFDDAEALRDPRFRKIAARAIARGVAVYFARRDGLEPILPPSPPSALLMENAASRAGLRIAWQPPAEGADQYVVYLSSDGRSFAEGIVTQDHELIVPPGDNGSAVYARVASLNQAGESLPSRVVGAKATFHESASVLVIAEFDRIDGTMLLQDDLSAFDLGTIERGFIDHINDLSHVSRYGNAIATYGASFASADARAVARNDIRLADYQAIIWFTGENAAGDRLLGPVERTLLTDYLAGGGQLLLTGAELAWTFDNILADEFSSYFQSTFGVAFVADDANTYELINADGPLRGIAPLSFDDQGVGSYDANFADVIAPLSGGPVLGYPGVVDGVAAVYSDELRVFYFGFPIETINGADHRAELIGRVLNEFEIEVDIDPPIPGDSNNFDSAGGCGCAANPAHHSGRGMWVALFVLLVFLVNHPSSGSHRPVS